MTRFIVAVLATSVIAAVCLTAQDQYPFKLGTFERQGRTFVGIVFGDAEVIDLAAAHKGSPSQQIVPPSDMKDLIARYDSDFVTGSSGSSRHRPSRHEPIRRLRPRSGAVRILPPIMYPTTMLNVAVNYREHARRWPD